MVVEGAGEVDVVGDEALDQFAASAGAQIAIGTAACYVCAAVFGRIGLVWVELEREGLDGGVIDRTQRRIGLCR